MKKPEELFEPLAYYALAICENDSDPQKTGQLIEKGFQVCKERGLMPFLTQGYYEYAKILFDRGDLQKAQGYLGQVIDLFWEMNMRWWLEQTRELEKRWS